MNSIYFLTSSSYVLFSTISFSTKSFSLLKSVGIVFNLSISSSSTIHFKLTKSVFLAKSDISTSVAFFTPDLVT